MERKITMMPIKEIEGFNQAEFWVHPKYSAVDRDLSSYIYDFDDGAEELLEEAKAAASAYDEICICIIEDELGKCALVESCSKGCSTKFVLFNAVNCSRAVAEARAVTPNTGRGARTKYWYDKWIRFEKGSVC